MQVQSLSIVVPNKACINRCPFCVSRMVKDADNWTLYENLMDINHCTYDINVREYIKRLRFVADNGCQTIMLTGMSEPQQNKQFLATFALIHQQMGSPFSNIEMQTTGFGLDDVPNYLRFLRNFVGVNTMCISVNAPTDLKNCEMLGHEPYKGHKTIPALNLEKLVGHLFELRFNIRICINLSDAFNEKSAQELFTWARGHLYANQITLRKLYTTTAKTQQNEWIRTHQPSKKLLDDIDKYLANRKVLGRTPYGATIYEGWNCTIVYDKDCMGKNPENDVKKFLILRPNCKLYSQWDSSTSLVF